MEFADRLRTVMRPPIEDVMAIRPQRGQEGRGRSGGRPAQGLLQPRPRLGIIADHRGALRDAEPIAPGSRRSDGNCCDAGGPESSPVLALEVSDGHHQVMPAHPALTVIRCRPGPVRKQQDVVPQPAVRPRASERADLIDGNAEHEHAAGHLLQQRRDRADAGTAQQLKATSPQAATLGGCVRGHSPSLTAPVWPVAGAMPATGESATPRTASRHRHRQGKPVNDTAEMPRNCTQTADLAPVSPG